MTDPTSALEEACSNYLRYLDTILKPAMAELKASIESRQAQLHRVFGANLFVAHAVDYIMAIRKLDGKKEDELLHLSALRYRWSFPAGLPALASS